MEIIFFVLGAIVASFIGVLVARLNTGQSFLAGRSRCDACHAPLSLRSLVPTISYLASGGRARCLRQPPLAICPAHGTSTRRTFALAYSTLGLTSALPFMFLALSALLALVLYDLAHQILPSSLLAVFVAASAATRLLSHHPSRRFFHCSSPPSSSR